MSMIPGAGGSALAVLGVAVALVAACRDDGGSSESTPIAQPASAQLEGLRARETSAYAQQQAGRPGQGACARRRCGEEVR
jgi:hypothetical protein